MCYAHADARHSWEGTGHIDGNRYNLPLWAAVSKIESKRRGDEIEDSQRLPEEPQLRRPRTAMTG
jgi:hypothetical protein